MKGRYRWWIGSLLFASTVINYIDRQTLNVLAPYLKVEFHWTNHDFSLIIIAFRAAYAVMQLAAGPIVDRIGTRDGLSLAVAWYSLAAMLTPLSSGLRSFGLFRFLLGIGEAGNWPAATKAVGEWFPRRERGWAVALFDSGSSVGAAIAPFLVLWIYHRFGGWRPAFLLTGCLGWIWLVVWRRSYHPPAVHPSVSADERLLIARDQADEDGIIGADRATTDQSGYRGLLSIPQTWGVVLGRSLTDPTWFMVTDWFAIYLVSRGYRLEDTLVGFWVPFLAADLGNFFGGGLSSHLIRRGWSVGRSRRTVITIMGFGMLMLIPAAFATSFVALITCFAVATFSYAAWSTMILALPADLFRSHAVATVAGMSGCGAGLGTIISTFLIGIIADRFSFAPILVGASLVPMVATILVLVLVQNNRHSGGRWVRAI